MVVLVDCNQCFLAFYLSMILYWLAPTLVGCWCLFTLTYKTYYRPLFNTNVVECEGNNKKWNERKSHCQCESSFGKLARLKTQHLTDHTLTHLVLHYIFIYICILVLSNTCLASVYMSGLCQFVRFAAYTRSTIDIDRQSAIFWWNKRQLTSFGWLIFIAQCHCVFDCVRVCVAAKFGRQINWQLILTPTGSISSRVMIIALPFVEP